MKTRLLWAWAGGFLTACALTALAAANSRTPQPGPAPALGKPVDGLAARAEVIKESGALAVRFSLKNVSDKPLVVCDYIPHLPLQVEWVGPDGKKQKSSHYAWLDDPRIGPQAPLSERSFVTLAPGGVHVIGPRGKDSTIPFAGGPAGAHKVTVRYANKEDGKRFKLTGVWTGTVAAPEVTLRVK